MTIPIKTRPRPLREVAQKITKWVGIAGSLVTSLVGFGVVTATQGDAIEGLVGVIPGAFVAVATLLTAFGIVRQGEPLVTPSSDPRDDRGVRLVPDGRPLVNYMSGQ